MFQIIGIKFPASLPVNTQFQVIGNVTLFGTPFVLPLWVVAQIQAPSAIITPGPLGVGHISTSTAMAIGGKFTITLPDGFKDTGDFSMKLNLYLGPTSQVGIGAGTYSVPPLPALFSTPSAKFSVASASTGGSNTGGNVTPGVTDLAIANYTTPIKVGDNCDVTVTFNYIGPAASMSLSAALGQIPPLGLTFNTMSKKAITINVPAATISTKQTFKVSVPVLSFTSNGGSPYAIEVYLNSQFIHSLSSGGLGTGGVVTVTAGTPTTPTITNARITNYTTPIAVGGKCTIQVSYDYIGPATTVNLYAALGNDKGILPFDTMASNTVSVSIPAATSATPRTASVDVTAVSATASSGSPYDIYAKLGSADMNRLMGVVVVTGGGVISTITAHRDSVLGLSWVTYSFSGFQPNAVVAIAIQGVNQANPTANSAGAGSDKFRYDNSPGDYAITAADQYGHVASVYFNIGAVTVAALTISPSQVTYGDQVTYSISGFNALSFVSIVIQGMEDSPLDGLYTDANGNGSGSFGAYLLDGSYTVIATDNAAHTTPAVSLVVSTQQQQGYNLSISISPSGAGSVSKSPDKSSYSAGETVQLVAYANSGYVFTEWDGIVGTPTSVVVNITMNQNQNIMASFYAPPVTTGPKFAVGDVIGIGGDTYTVHAVSPSTNEYILGEGYYPNDVVSYNWVGSDYIDSIATLIGHVYIG